MGWDLEKPQMVVSGWVAGTWGASRVENPGQAPVFFLKLPDWHKEISYDPRGRFFIYSKPADDNFEYQLYRNDINSKTVTLLTDGKSKNRYPIFSNSGNLLAFACNHRDQKDTEIYVMDPIIHYGQFDLALASPHAETGLLQDHLQPCAPSFLGLGRLSRDGSQIPLWCSSVV